MPLQIPGCGKALDLMAHEMDGLVHNDGSFLSLLSLILGGGSESVAHVRAMLMMLDPDVARLSKNLG